MLSDLFPEVQIAKTAKLLAFVHPRLSHYLHILLIPKQPAANLFDLQGDRQCFMSDLLKIVEQLVKEFDLDQYGYRLIVNGGAYQDFPYLHFHLVADQAGDSWKSG